jgi:hypothetical protein
VVLLTHNTPNSAYVHQEIGRALTPKKLVIPLVQPGIGTAQLAMLASLEFDFEEPQPALGFATAIKRGWPRSTASNRTSRHESRSRYAWRWWSCSSTTAAPQWPAAERVLVATARIYRFSVRRGL